MRSRFPAVRVALLVGLGLAFFGCVGLPRRRVPVDEVPRDTRDRSQQAKANDPVVRRPVEPEPLPDPLRIPIETKPTRPMEIIPTAGTVADPPTSVDPPTPPPPSNSGSDVPPPMKPAAPVNGSLAVLRQIQQKAVAQYASMDSYMARFTRREYFKGKLHPEEVMLFKFRKEPWSVYLKWIGQEGRGREALYVKGQHESKIHILLAAGDMPLMPAGKRMSFEPDNILVRSSSRHPVTSAGVGNLIERFSTVLEGMERNDPSVGTATYLGRQKRPEFSVPVEAVEWKIPAELESSLPRGGRRWCFFDPDNNLPALLITHDDQGQLVEYYRYDRFQFPVTLDNDDFNPDRLWPKPKNKRLSD